MNIEEFEIKYGEYGFRDKISIFCSTEGCENHMLTNKDSAVRNIKKHGTFKCRTCCYTEDGKKRISESTSYKRSPETCRKMAEAKIAFYLTEEGKKLKKKLSVLTAENHSVHKYDKSKRRGVFESKKTGRKLSYDSSYELRLCWLLDSDETVLDFETQLGFQINGRGRCLDCLVTYKSGRKKVIEMKPKQRIDEFKNQIEDTKEYANQNNWDFQLMTEDDLGMNYKQIRLWADDYRTENTGIDYHEYRKENNRKKAKKHYHEKIALDKVNVYCEYCKENHSVLKKSHDSNIKRNGKYICEKEGGHISGSKPKPHLIKENPYAKEGKKQCKKCNEIKFFELFNKDKSRRDGYREYCKDCESIKQKEKYKKSRSEKPTAD